MTSWWADNLLLSTLAMLLVLALRRPTVALFGAGAAHALWLVPLVRLLLPPLPALDAIPLAVLPLAAGLGEAASLPPSGGSGQWRPVLLAVWAGGAVVFLLYQWFAYRAFLRRVSLSATTLGSVDGVPLLESGAVDGPVALGLIDPRTLAPLDFADRWSGEERRLALAHERAHHARGDLWWSALALVVLAAHWFDPVAWFAHRAFRADAELACDAAVVASLALQARRPYADALLKSASPSGPIAACPLNPADQLKRRLTMLTSHRSNRARRVGGGATLAAALAGAVMLGAPAGAQVSGSTSAAQSQHGAARVSDPIVLRLKAEEPIEAALTNCGGADQDALENALAKAGAEDRVVFCSKKSSTSAARLQQLKLVSAALAAKPELFGEKKEQVLAALDRQIAALEAQ